MSRARLWAMWGVLLNVRNKILINVHWRCFENDRTLFKWIESFLWDLSFFQNNELFWLSKVNFKSNLRHVTQLTKPPPQEKHSPHYYSFHENIEFFVIFFLRWNEMNKILFSIQLNVFHRMWTLNHWWHFFHRIFNF